MNFHINRENWQQYPLINFSVYIKNTFDEYNKINIFLLLLNITWQLNTMIKNDGSEIPGKVIRQKMEKYFIFHYCFTSDKECYQFLFWFVIHFTVPESHAVATDLGHNILLPSGSHEISALFSWQIYNAEECQREHFFCVSTFFSCNSLLFRFQ